MYAAAVAVILLPVLGLGLSYLAETRRGIASMVLFGSWLSLAAAVVLLAVVVRGGGGTHSATVTFWSFQVSQTPFHAVVKTSLAANFMVGVGYAANPTTAVLALLVSLIGLLTQLQVAIQFRRDHRLGQLIRLSALLTVGALLLVLAAELFQVLIGFEICGLAAALLVSLGRSANAGGAARSAYLIWRGGALALLLGVGFIYVKFSGPVSVAAAAAAAAATKHKVKLPTPDGLNLVALDHVFATVGKGLVNGVGGRSLALAAVLILVAAACACGLLPGHSQARHLGSAPGAAAALVLTVAGGITGAALLLQSFSLLRWASGVLPALVVLATLTGLLAALLACREQRLRRLAVWLGLSQTALALTGIGLGSPPAAIALLVGAALASAALLGAASSLALDQRVDSISQLGAAWRLARPPTLLLLAALGATTGILGLGTSLGHAAVLAAAFGSSAPGAPVLPATFTRIAAAGEILSLVLVALAAARVALITVRGEESPDPREARLVRRQLAQGRGPQLSWPNLVTTALALVSGLVCLPAVGFGLGPFLSAKPGHTALPLSGLALLLALVLPALSVGAMALLRRRLRGAGAAEPSWLGWADGSRLAVAGDTQGLGLAGWAVQSGEALGLEPLAAAAAGGAAELAQLGSTRPGLRWGWGSGVVLALALGLAVAILLWSAGHPGLGMP